MTLASPYLPRRPTETVLYRAVRQHLETFLAHAEESYAAPLPRYVAPNILSVAHWERLHAGALFATAPRVDWATLLRRTFSVDVLSCAKCGGRLRVMGMVDEPWLVSQLLGELGLPTEAPRAARARDPTTLDGDDE